MKLNSLKSFVYKGIFLFLFAGIIFTSMISCDNTMVKEETPIIGKADLKLESDLMTPEVLWSFGRLGDVQVSPDGKTLLYGVSYYSKELNKSNRELFTLAVEGGTPKQITKTAGGEYNAIWSGDGNKIFFLAAAEKGLQIWSINPDGTERIQISNEAESITNIKLSPSGTKILFTCEIKIDKNVNDMHSDLPMANAKLYDDIMYRHWDVWEDGYYGHIFVADLVNGKVEASKDIMAGEPYESPLMPFGGIEEITWSPDSKTVAYTCKKLKGKDYSISTNSDIYLYNLETGSMVHHISRVLRSTDLLCAGNDGHFSVMLPETDSMAGSVLLQRMRDGLKAEGVLEPVGETGGQVTPQVSLAVVTYPTDGTQLESLMRTLEARIVEQRSGGARSREAEGATLADTIQGLALRAEVVSPHLTGQVLDFLIDEASRRPSEQGLLFVAPGSDWRAVLGSRLDTFCQTASRTQLVVAAKDASVAESSEAVTLVSDEGLGSPRLCLLYWGERPAYALVAGEPTPDGAPTAFHTADRALVEQLAIQLRRDLPGIPELDIAGGAE